MPEVTKNMAHLKPAEVIPWCRVLIGKNFIDLKA